MNELYDKLMELVSNAMFLNAEYSGEFIELQSIDAIEKLNDIPKDHPLYNKAISLANEIDKLNDKINESY